MVSFAAGKAFLPACAGRLCVPFGDSRRGLQPPALFLFLLLLVIVVLLGGCANPASTLVAAANVNGQTIPLDQYLRFVEINKSLCQLQNQLTNSIQGPIDWNDPARRDDLAAVRRMSLNELVNADLTNEQAAAHHITVSSQAVDQLLSELQQQGALLPSDLLPSLHASQDDLRILARQELQQQALLQLMPNLTTPDAHIAYIVVKTQATAEEVLAQLQQGASFDALAGKYSQDRTRGSGGDAGEVVPGQSPPALDQVYFHTPPGKVVGPIAVAQPAGRLCFVSSPGVEPPISQQQGAPLYYIVKVLSRQTVPIADVNNAINDAQDAAFTSWLRQGANIQVLVDF